MATIKYNPHDLLEEEGISKKLLSEQALHSLALFDKAMLLYGKHKDSADFKKGAEDAAKITYDLIIKEVTRVKSSAKEEADTTEKQLLKKSQSKKILAQSNVIMDDLEICRNKLREDRKRKLESGEIQPPKKKTLTSKLRNELVNTIKLIPKNLKEDSTVLQRTQKAILKLLNELKEIWGLNKIKPIEDELKEKFEKLIENAA